MSWLLCWLSCTGGGVPPQHPGTPSTQGPRTFSTLLLHFDQLECQAVDVLDQNRARVGELVGALEDAHVGGLEVSDHRIEIRIRQADVIDHLAARFGQRLIVTGTTAAVAALPWIPQPAGIGGAS